MDDTNRTTTNEPPGPLPRILVAHVACLVHQNDGVTILDLNEILTILLVVGVTPITLQRLPTCIVARCHTAKNCTRRAGA